MRRRPTTTKKDLNEKVEDDGKNGTEPFRRANKINVYRKTYADFAPFKNP